MPPGRPNPSHEPPADRWRDPYVDPYLVQPSLCHDPYNVQDPYGECFGISQVGPVSVAENCVSGTRQQSTPPGARPLRVIHVGQCLVSGGIESWLKSLIRFCDPQRIRFPRLIVTGPLHHPHIVRSMPVPVEFGGEESVRRAARDCDVLLISGPAEIAGWLGQSPRPVCVGVAHGDAIWTRNILLGCGETLDHVVAVSQRVQRLVCEGFSSSVIYHGLDTSHLTRTAPRDEVRARFGFSKDDFVLGSVMRLSSEKAPELLVEAIARLPRQYKLLLVGWGPLKQKLLNLANDSAPLRCVITSADEHLGDYYRAFDSYCLPSHSEGFGLATLEALFCGVPVITTATGFAQELLEDGVHFLQCTAQASSIAELVERLGRYPAWAQAMALEGQRCAEQFGFARRMCREYEELLTRLWTERQVRKS